MQKLECGICRTPFKREYFENDPIANELFDNNNNNNNINDNNQIGNNNILNLIQNINSINRQIIYRQIINSNSNRNYNLNVIIAGNNRNIIGPNNHINYNISSNRNNLRNNIHNNTNPETEVLFGLFILAFQPTKAYCIVSFLLNIFFCGLGTILIGLNKKSIFYTLFGLIQCFCFFFFLLYGVSLNERKIFGNVPNRFFYIYFKIIYISFYISSIYIGIFRNFLFFNTRKINFNEKKEIGSIIFFLNILIGGIGTLLVAIIRFTEPQNLCNAIKNIIYGLIQLGGYILTLLGISLINEKNNNVSFDSYDIGCFFIVGILCFFFSIYCSYKFFKSLITNIGINII